MKSKREPAWRDAFRGSCLKVGLQLSLTRPMVEFLSAVADGVHWDRSVFGSCQAFPDYLMAPDEPAAWLGLLGAVVRARRVALAGLGRLKPTPTQGEPK